MVALNCRSTCRPERVNLLDLRSASTFDATFEGVLPACGGSAVSVTVTTDSSPPEDAGFDDARGLARLWHPASTARDSTTDGAGGGVGSGSTTTMQSTTRSSTTGGGGGGGGGAVRDLDHDGHPLRLGRPVDDGGDFGANRRDAPSDGVGAFLLVLSDRRVRDDVRRVHGFVLDGPGA